MPIAARVVRRTLIAAGVTLLEVPPEGLGATALYGLHNLEMRNRQRMGAAIRLAIVAKNIG
jgi:hypothetical protein